VLFFKFLSPTVITRSGHKIEIGTSCSLCLCWCVYNGLNRSRSYLLIALEWSREEMSLVYRRSVSGLDGCVRERSKTRFRLLTL
jgi:hypothetical protein